MLLFRSAEYEIKQIREAANVSQAVFASILNTSLSTVQKWEIGNKRPTGTALKLLHLVRERGQRFDNLAQF
jgi:putative transcriptional regulator